MLISLIFNKNYNDQIMIWRGPVARIGKARKLCQFWLENVKAGDYPEELGVDVKIILKLILRK